MHGTSLNTRTAAGTLRVVNGRKVVDNGNRTVRTSLLTLHTADTAIRASLTGDGALIVARAFDHNAGNIGNKMNDTVGTLACANATTDTSLGIDVRNAILN